MEAEVDCEFRYLDERYGNATHAMPSVAAAGGHRGDSIPFKVKVRDGRVWIAEEDLEERGFCLVELTQAERDAAASLPLRCLQDSSPGPLQASTETQYFGIMEQVAIRATKCAYARAFNAVVRDSGIKGVHTRALDDRAARGPVNDVHSDYSDNAPGVLGLRKLLAKLGLETARFAVVNLWRSIGSEPVQTWPLAVCDASSVLPQDRVERISPENNNVIFNLLPNPAHKWYFYDRMDTHECLVFRQYDSLKSCKSRFTPHTAFDLHKSRGGKTAAPPPVRESVETRVLCIFDDDARTFAPQMIRAAQKNGTLADTVNLPSPM